MADRYRDRDGERYGGREREEEGRIERYRQGLDYRGPYDVVSRRTRGGGYDEGREYGEEPFGGRGERRDYGRGYGREYGAEDERGFRRDDERDVGRDFGRGYGRERYYGGEYGGEYGRGYERERFEGRGYERGYDYGEEDDRDYRRREYRRDDDEDERGKQTDYGRTSSRFFGRGGGGEYEGRYARGYDYEGDDEERRGRRYEDDDDDEERGAGRRSRGWLDRVSDEVASWFGDREAVRRRRLDEKRARRQGRGPKNYRRSDERIREDINDRLSDQDYLDASEIDVSVNGGEVVLNGTVGTRYDKRLAEDIAESVFGVSHVQNNLRVVYRDEGAASSRTDETTIVASRPAATTGPLTNPAAGVSNDPTFNERHAVAASYDTTADTLPGVTNETNAGGTDDLGGGTSSSSAASGGRK